MKTMTKDGKLIRCGDQESFQHERDGWRFCSKSEWKELEKPSKWKSVVDMNKEEKAVLVANTKGIKGSVS